MDQDDWRKVEFDLETGICLWMGAGISTHLSRSVGGTVPQWRELTEDLERQAGLVVDPKSKNNFPERLEICTTKLGTAAVRRKIARAVYGDLCVYLLSVSAAFENNLWIVGMSLDDKYLRRQLARHRKQINRIRWFNTEKELAKHKRWARKNNITSMCVDWPAFWRLIGKELQPQIRLSGAMSAWYYVIETALSELYDGTQSEQLAELTAEIPELAHEQPKATSEGE